ncbi:MAG: CPBP family intramembrane metalloprotease [Syntrophomonadaceae bacterium]|nr:CPBP family intramembrane metalloprotease [Syntrophomonadaceae bacterium]
MRKLSPSIGIYVGLVTTLAFLATVSTFLPQGTYLPLQELPASKPVIALVNALTMLVLYGGLGYIGLRLAQKVGFAEVWDAEVSNRQRFLIPASIGVGLGIFFVLADAVFSRLHSLGPLPHPPFPTSLVASAVAGIGEEIVFRLFFISFFTWLVSHVILKKKWEVEVFWAVAVFSALAFAAGHIPSVMILSGLNMVNDMPFALLAEIFLLNGVLSLFAAYYFRKYGFLAAVGIHFWTNIIWHVVYGLF